jgi:murein DD-endopeptidase MepM/ murein hydrolase activator NlpD
MRWPRWIACCVSASSRIEARRRLRRWRLAGALLLLPLALLACNALPSVLAGEGTPAPPNPTNRPAATPDATPLPPGSGPSATPPALLSPTTGPTETASATRPPSATPATPCASQACASAAAHFWLDRPIPTDEGLITYVDRSYPYASTQGGLRDAHHGVEFFNPGGTPIIAAAPGVVIVAGNDEAVAYGPAPGFYGNLVVVQLDREYLGQPVFNLYGHMRSVSVAPGDRVQAGDLLGVVGATGIAIGSHLHFEVRIGFNDYASTRNPELWLKPAVVDGQPYGAIAGRVVDTAGNLTPEVTVVIRPIRTVSDATRSRFLSTYTDLAETLNGDDQMQENFAIGDVPPGTYSVSVSTTRFYQQVITVNANQVTWVMFVVNPPGPRPPTPLPETATALAATAYAPPPTPTIDPAEAEITPAPGDPTAEPTQP